jgi:peroxiredoxin (alkyl hydroperoxide reductase subunit C)
MGKTTGFRVIISILTIACLFAVFPLLTWARGSSDSVPQSRIYEVGELKPVDSTLKVEKGMQAPDFTLPAVSGENVSLSDFRGRKNVVLSFVPAAWTPVCSGQWPGYNIARNYFEENDAVLLGISVDNVPTLFAWTRAMGGLWFPVLSDFYPHGEVADRYGVLRSDGTAERALFVIDKKGIIRYIDVHNINELPRLEELVRELRKLGSRAASP